MKNLLDVSALAAIMPDTPLAQLEKYAVPMQQALPEFSINTALRQAHFLAQVAHESNAFRSLSENLNYSANALKQVFGKYFANDEMVEQYARHPEMIANHVYANRMGNGDSTSGDGWGYRGRGLIQLTGKDNYQSFGQAIGEDIVAAPDRVADEPQLAVRAACWFWDNRQLNRYADEDDVRLITRRINGGLIGLKDREKYLLRAKAVLEQ